MPLRCWRTCVLVIDGASMLYAVTLALQWALLVAAALGGVCASARCCWPATTSSRPPRLPLGLWDWLRHGTDAGWDVAEGTR